jgi:hypothetical protein
VSEKKLVMEMQFEHGGEVLDLTYLPALLRELDHLLEMSERGDIVSESAVVHNSFELLTHIREVMVKKEGE